VKRAFVLEIEGLTVPMRKPQRYQRIADRRGQSARAHSGRLAHSADLCRELP
jgi:hypothetical protein